MYWPAKIPCCSDEYEFTRNRYFQSSRETYSELRPKAEVQNEINDFLLVDRDYLKIYEELAQRKFSMKSILNSIETYPIETKKEYV